jgi:formylglycine-generating enzyme required for sulfatase activity
MGHLFISYSHKDEDYVHHLREDLLKQGFSVWTDDRIDSDVPWPKIVQDHLNNCDALILIVSENTFESEWAQKEVSRAKRIGKPVFSILILGNMWPSVESTRDMDGKNKELLPEKFYERLALVTPRDEHRVKETLTKREPAPKPALSPQAELVEASSEGPAAEAPKFNIKQIGWWVLALVGALGIVVVLWLNGTFRFASVPVPTNSPTVHPLVIASLTPTRAITATPITATPGSSSLATTADQSASIILVPPGNFIMGSYKGHADETPIHTVYLDAFYIDKYEVTNALYKSCVDANVCIFPQFDNSYSRQTYYGDSRYDQYPVIGVTWEMAKAYCEWRKARLPTEAEWEKAARGTDGHMYPWGESIDPSRANYNDNSDPNYVGDTSKVDAYSSGVSPYGLFDMAGNVWEWVADIYDANYYASLTLPIANPLGPTSGLYRVIKGGSWDSNGFDLRSARRNFNDPSKANVYLGFRCARNP